MFTFEKFLKEKRITEEEFDSYPEYKQELYYAEYERRKWK